jgi:hypothetical protein
MIQIESAAVTLPQLEEPQACCAGPKEQEQHHEQPGRHMGHDHHGDGSETASLNRTSLMATLHCLTGCTIGEVLGMVIGTALGWSNWPTVALAVALAFLFGYGMTLLPLRRTGMAWGEGTRAGLRVRYPLHDDDGVGGQCDHGRDPRRHGRRIGRPDILGEPARLAGPGRRRSVPSEPLVDRTRQRSCVGACASLPLRRLLLNRQSAAV